VLHRDVSVVVPARNEEATIGPIVEAVAALAEVGEVVVVDDGSTDATAATAAKVGARVVTASGGPGKGAAMWDGVAAANGDLIVFCDADLTDFDARFVTTLARTLVEAGDGAVLVKADYDRPSSGDHDGNRGSGSGGGRVNQLVARPVLRLLHPDVAHIAQPLGGEYAAWRSALEEVPFVCGYGVELGLLIDLANRYGASAISEVHLGVRRHRNRTLAELAPQAEEVLAVALQRAGVGAGDGVNVDERPPLATLPHRRRPRRSA
jgi:glucosyl-3-phosphoglycerate synthase